MIRYLLSIVFMLAVLSCKEDKISKAALKCYSQFEGIRRSTYVVDVPVMVSVLQRRGIVSTQLIASNSVSWGGCNLPVEFQQDSLAIYVTGYYLTSDRLETMNLIPLPFEVTSAKLR